MKKLFLLILTTLLYIPSFSQSITGTISYGTEKVPNALIYTKNSEELPVYSDTNGFFELKNIKENDTLVVKSIGFEDKEIPLSSSKTPLNIELEQTSTMLNEIIIQAINSEWTSFLQKPKPRHWTNIVVLFESRSVLTKFVAKEDMRFNGIAFYAKNQSEVYTRKRLRPLIFKHSIAPENSIIQSEVEVFTVPKNNEGKNNKNPYRIEFVFNHIIEIKKGETVFIGIEQLPENYNTINYSNTLMLGPVVNLDHPDLTTYLYYYLFNNNLKKAHYLPILGDVDLYFELKTVK